MRYLRILIFIILGFNPVYSQKYIVIGWNDLGMHCANKDFQNMAILPPYNNLVAQVIRVGDMNNPPEIVTNNFRITYEIPGNTYSVGKTNFWDYEDKLFGVQLPDNVGLTGKGLSGDMDVFDDHFQAEGIPATPYTDDNLASENPYQLALLQVIDPANKVVATTQPVIPVSNEINCVSSGCHSSEMDILNEHEGADEGGIDPVNRPFLCSSCHADPALGMEGKPGLKSLSEVIHEKHKDKTNDCYKCHPGTHTQCLRGTMFARGMMCQDCHGDMKNVAGSIKNGRRPWLDEPSCGSTSCHGANYAEEPNTLFRLSHGHGGLYCSACHGSPHAILPSTNSNDNVQNVALQGHAGILKECSVCHGFTPAGAGPHNFIVPVELSSFSAHVDGQAVDLRWNINMALNLYGFEIQRSSDKENFQQIGFVQASKSNGTFAAYTFLDDKIQSGAEYTYRLKIVDLDGSMTFSAPLTARAAHPISIRLLANYPNPFNPSTRINFELPSEQNVQIQIYDQQGREIRSLVHQTMGAGYHEVVWNGLNDDGRTIPSGIYFCKLKAAGQNLSRQMTFLK